jgi:hypothetical protein
MLNGETSIFGRISAVGTKKKRMRFTFVWRGAGYFDKPVMTLLQLWG